jgi:DNA-binding Lrp family transcriptional regulator
MVLSDIDPIPDICPDGPREKGERVDVLPALDEVDETLVRHLVRDGRISISALAERANVSRATAYARFDRLIASGVITGFSANVDPAKVGLPVTALILANVDQHNWQTLRAEWETLPGLEYMAFTSGGFDVVLVVRVPDVVALRDVVLVRLQGSPQVRSTQTIFVLDEHSLRLGR